MTPQELIVTTTDGDALAATAARGRRRVLVEVPTLLLIVATYSAWLVVTFAYGSWPFVVVAPLTVILLTLHSSLQHEIVHGHPTRWHSINRLLGMVPLSFWMPFERYRVLHRVHHVDARLTDPLDDPESYYWTRESWAQLKPITRLFLRIQQTLAGRILIGSFWRIGMFWHAEWRAAKANVHGVRRAWLEHLLWCVPVIVWIRLACEMPLWVYVVAMVIPSNAIVLIRAFAEHRARPAAPNRVALVEGSWILGPLFLFNNLHALHHETPAIPWYEYPARYRLDRERLIAANGGLVYATYFDVARRYMFRTHDALEHPTDRVPPGPG
ncbi:MAG TPA: fatty acid desaturase [Steroidobacteraceae bacterium]|nr:fatty acid desaturase [Steroidobacteraceae bacterium]